MTIDEVKEILLSTGVLPPTLASELADHLEAIPAEQAAWLITLVRQAEKADRDYVKAAKQYLEVAAERRAKIERAITKRADEIMAEFERELAEFELSRQQA